MSTGHRPGVFLRRARVVLHRRAARSQGRPRQEAAGTDSSKTWTSASNHSGLHLSIAASGKPDFTGIPGVRVRCVRWKFKNSLSALLKRLRNAPVIRNTRIVREMSGYRRSTAWLTPVRSFTAQSIRNGRVVDRRAEFALLEVPDRSCRIRFRDRLPTGGQA